MAYVRVEQRNAHLAGPVRLEFVNGRDGKVAKATLTAISNTRRGLGDGREDEPMAVQWTLWGKQAENAAEYLGKGSQVNIVGRMRHNNYQDRNGKLIYALAFICEEIDYLDSKAESEARRARHGGSQSGTDAESRNAAAKPPRSRKASNEAASGEPGSS